MQEQQNHLFRKHSSELVFNVEIEGNSSPFRTCQVQFPVLRFIVSSHFRIQ